MTPESIARMLCRGSKACMEELEDLGRLVDELDAIAERETETIEVDSLEPPLLHHVQGLKEVHERLKSETGNDDIALYVVRRALYMKYWPRLAGRAGGMKCPICGQPPTLMVFKKVSEGAYDGMIPYARCNCGAEWKYSDEWRCPSCQAADRSVFRILVSSSTGLEVRICRKCGFRMAVARNAGGDLHKLQVYTNLILEAVEA